MPASSTSPSSSPNGGIPGGSRLHVVATVFALILALGALVAVVVTARTAADSATSSDARFAKLETQGADFAAFKEKTTEKETKKRMFSFHGYRFDLPTDWQADRTENGAEFVSDIGEPVARLSCPPPETGYEAWSFQETKRQVTAHERGYEFRLLLGTPDVALYGQDVKGLGDLNVLFFSRLGDSVDDWNASCMLLSQGSLDAFDGAFKSIYDSARIE